MRFEVPQFIEVEDKIFGPFTWKQFVYLAGGAGAGFILYVILPFFLFLVLVVPVAVLVAGLAFYRHNNQPFSVLLESMVRYVSGSRLYLWRKENKRVVGSGGEGGSPKSTYKPPSSENSIASLSRKLEIHALEKK